MAIRIEKRPTKLQRQQALMSGQVPITAKAAVTKKIDVTLPEMIKQAARKLQSATTAAEVLEAKADACIAYEVAKMSARIAKAKDAHDKVVAAAHRSQADALEIEARAKRRLADEYDAAQTRGEVGRRGKRNDLAPEMATPTADDVGLSRKEVMDARQVRDAIVANPAVVKEALEEILHRGDEPTRAALKREMAPIQTQIRAETQKAKKVKRAEREIILAEKIKALPGAKFGIIVADPEWEWKSYSEETGMDRAAANHYPTSSTEVIAERGVESIAADDCVLFLWATAPRLPDALQVLASWGFTYKTHAIWFKQRSGDGRGTGYWFLGEHEILLVGTKGNVVSPAMGTQFRSVFMAPVGEHSAKPEIALEMIEAYFPNIPKIELNRRGPAREGWSAWGAEAT